MASQIFFGSLLLAFCAVIYIVSLVVTGTLVHSRLRRHDDPYSLIRSILLVGVIVVAIVFGHSIVIWIWSMAFLLSNALPNMEESVYFTIVTYTTLGYGDLTLSVDYRVFGTMAAVSGLLNFGLSTAFLAAIVVRILPAAKADLTS